MQTYSDKYRFATNINTFQKAQNNNKPVTYVKNQLNKRRKATSIPTFDFSTLHSKFPHIELLIVLNSLIDFYFDGEESKYITVNSYEACCVKNITGNVIRLNKQRINNEVAYCGCSLLHFSCYFTVGPKILW